jgi:hypothetical protein
MPLNSIFGWLLKKRIHQIDLFKKHPLEVQEEWFHRLLSFGRETHFGIQYQFDKIANYDDFRREVPLSDYDSLKPWIDRSMKGEGSVLWPGETKWFAKSSGTTSDRSKFIPVTKDSLEECHYRGGKDLLAINYNLYPNSKLYIGKHLVVGGSADYNQVRPDSDSYIGDLSAIIMKNLPWWAEIKRIPSKEIALMSNWEEKIEKLAISTMDEDVSSISGVPSWTLVLLNRILEYKKKENILEVWPNLELFMHGGVSFEPYRKEFERLIPSKNMHYIESYNASEGFFGIQDQKDGDLLLMLDYGIFFEFIPMDYFDGIDSKTVVGLNEVELDKNYAIVISTNGGLWRYIVGDTVKFSSRSPYRIQVSGRTSHFINSFGEEVIVANSDDAIAHASKLTGAEVKDYTACPVYMEGKSKGGHEWLIEFGRKPADMKLFSEELDKRLREINSDYDAKRTGDLTLRFPLIHVATSGCFELWLKEKGKLGGQHKVPRLANTRLYFDEIMQFQHGIEFEG